MQQLIGIYGASGFGRELLPLIREQYPEASLCFVDDGSKDEALNGYKIYNYEAYLSLASKDKAVVLAIANSKIRELLVAKCCRDNVAILSTKGSPVLIWFTA